MNKKVGEHGFSVEIQSERFVKRMTFLDSETAHFFFEGFLGQLQSVSMLDDLMLEIEGANGVMRVDITRQEIARCLGTKKEPVGGEQQ